MGKASRKYYRTIFLGVAAMAALVWSAMDQFDIPWEVIQGLMLTTLAVIGLVIVAAAITVSLWMGLRKLLHANDDP